MSRVFFRASCQSGLCLAWIPSNLVRTKKGGEGREVEPEVRGVGVPPDGEEAEVLQADPGDRSVAKVAHPAVQPRQVTRHHRHVSRMAARVDMFIYQLKNMKVGDSTSGQCRGRNWKAQLNQNPPK